MGCPRYSCAQNASRSKGGVRVQKEVSVLACSLELIANIESNREHIIPDALGGPNSLALNADAKTNSELGEGLDSRLINSPLMAMLASRAGVQARSGPVTVKLQGQLLADGSPVDIRISEDGDTTFVLEFPWLKIRLPVK